ncbi:tail fiber assembly protein [Pseudomonas sp. Leaf59]|uniref:tail fiber assembly protein n=1 Tax=Pseudomonas sp. Leaf59 TaxID=2876556 RepID=UPI001E377E49|nr:tail fiber assembly protein [Pseudomonas sp. Leaf59]
MSESTLMVYQAHPVTGEYLGPCQADADPLDEGKWLIPAMAFTDVPPEPKPGFAIAHIAGKKSAWSLVVDFRGIVYQVSNGEAVEWHSLGPLPEELTAEAYPGPFHVWKDGAWSLDEALEAEVLTQQALGKRDGMLIDAATRISPLQDAVDLGDASAKEQAELEGWKRYRVALNRIQQQPGFPKTIDWPSVPNTSSDSEV